MQIYSLIINNRPYIIFGVHGFRVNITATPAEGYEFNEWVGEVANTGSAETTVVMEKDQTVTAVFEEFDDHVIVVIEFEDENLEQAVREAIGKLEGELYLSDVIHLEELEAEGKCIESLEGIQHLQSLRRLRLGRDWNEGTYNIEDISPLVANTGFGSGDEIDMRWNYLDLSEDSQKMQETTWIECGKIDTLSLEIKDTKASGYSPGAFFIYEGFYT